MHSKTLEQWAHDHTFGQDSQKPGERRTWIVIVITLITMAVEIAAGIVFGSMALLADGIHMASHASALGIAAFAYIYARRHATNPNFSFGTGKVNSLAAFASALLLAIFALAMAWESTMRLLTPVAIAFNQAIAVACVGLVVNAVSALILNTSGHSHGHSHSHTHHDGHHHDHNLRAAYIHVIADALTSVLAIGALIAGKFLGWAWLDPVMGLVGAGLIIYWAYGLIKESSAVLLDREVSDALSEKAKQALEHGSDARVIDLHIWPLGPGIRAGAVSLITAEPKEPGHYKALLDDKVHLDHVTVEVHRCTGTHT